MFPSIASDLDLISSRSSVRPYNIRTKKDNAEYIAIAAPFMSTETAVRTLDEVSDVEQEVQKIEEEQGAAANQGI